MSFTDRFAERICAVFLPEADTVDVDDDLALNSDGAVSEPAFALTDEPLRQLHPWLKFCSTRLKQGSYALSFNPNGRSIFGTRYRGTLRIEHHEVDSGVTARIDSRTRRVTRDRVGLPRW